MNPCPLSMASAGCLDLNLCNSMQQVMLYIELLIGHPILWMKKVGPCNHVSRMRSRYAILQALRIQENDGWQRLPLRPTKSLLSVSLERLELGSRPYHMACDLWNKNLSYVLPNLLHFIRCVVLSVQLI